MRIGIIGLGRIGAFHARDLAALAVVEELVVTDAVPELAAQAVAERARRHGGGGPADVLAAGRGRRGHRLLDSHPSRPDPRLRARRASRPSARSRSPQTAKEAVALAEELAGSDVPVQIGFPRRFDPAYVAARDDLLAGRLGYLHTVRSTTLDPAPPPEAYIAGSGGIFHDCAIHDFDSSAG